MVSVYYLSIDIGVRVLNEETENSGEAESGSQMDRCGPSGCSLVHVTAFIQEQFHHLVMVPVHTVQSYSCMVRR